MRLFGLILWSKVFVIHLADVIQDVVKFAFINQVMLSILHDGASILMKNFADAKYTKQGLMGAELIQWRGI